MFEKCFSIKYNIILKLISLLSVFKFIYPKKYRNWFLGQEKIFVNFKKNDQKSIWIHCASLGEYEQIKPLIPALKIINKNINITFFSSSGYLNFTDFKLINQISYLPLDTKFNMDKFIHVMNPIIVLVSKQDIWPNMITYLSNHKIPLYLVGCKLQKTKISNWLFSRYYEQYLSQFNFIFCEDYATSQFIDSKKIPNKIIGNLRIQQVLIDSKLNFNDINIKSFTQNKKVIIYGSIENSDYKIIDHTIHSRKDVMHIIVPHEIDKTNTQKLKNAISSESLMYSEIQHANQLHHNVLIVDVFGILKQLYRYSNIAYIGGGFNKGVHNTLEPAIHGNLILFGPKHIKFPETSEFIKKGIASVVKDKFDCEQKIHQFLKEYKSRKSVKNKVSDFFESNTNNITMITDHIQTDLKTK
tara:strand:- start:905 stop:2143 length:1239 start_codon:yes stop_codon:yes gene_type:complete